MIEELFKKGIQVTDMSGSTPFEHLKKWKSLCPDPLLTLFTGNVNSCGQEVELSENEEGEMSLGIDVWMNAKKCIKLDDGPNFELQRLSNMLKWKGNMYLILLLF